VQVADNVSRSFSIEACKSYYTYETKYVLTLLHSELENNRPTYDGEMFVDYLGIYQRKGQTNIEFDHPNYPIAKLYTKPSGYV
jgi:hypothetical protein